jgi:hypothetical protein
VFSRILLRSFSGGTEVMLGSSKMTLAPLFFTENGSFYKMFSRAPELEPERSPTKQV